LGLDAPSGVTIQSINGTPEGSIIIKTTTQQDAKITYYATKSQILHNYEGKMYNIYTNNCKDAVSDDINSSGAGLQILNPSSTIKPNTWFKELKISNEKQ